MAGVCFRFFLFFRKLRFILNIVLSCVWVHCRKLKVKNWKKFIFQDKLLDSTTLIFSLSADIWSFHDTTRPDSGSVKSNYTKRTKIYQEKELTILTGFTRVNEKYLMDEFGEYIELEARSMKNLNISISIRLFTIHLITKSQHSTKKPTRDFLFPKTVCINSRFQLLNKDRRI